MGSNATVNKLTLLIRLSLFMIVLSCAGVGAIMGVLLGEIL